MNLKEIKKIISISPGNIKTGKIPAISLPPIKTCNVKAGCTNGACYALKAYRLYPSVKQAWNLNLDSFKSSPATYFKAIDAWLTINAPKYFRWHVSGDIPNKRYLDGMVKIAKNHPGIKFLAFTKKYNLLRYIKSVQFNLSIVISSWPGLPLPDTDFPIAFMQDGTENRVSNAIECPGNCEHCGMCWQLTYINKNVVFQKH
jgi:hypothetical protein